MPVRPFRSAAGCAPERVCSSCRYSSTARSGSAARVHRGRQRILQEDATRRSARCAHDVAWRIPGSPLGRDQGRLFGKATVRRNEGCIGAVKYPAATSSRCLLHSSRVEWSALRSAKARKRQMAFRRLCCRACAGPGTPMWSRPVRWCVTTPSPPLSRPGGRERGLQHRTRQ